jgi:hypothetical protein
VFLFEKLNAGEIFKVETNMQNKNHQNRWIQITAAPHYEDGKFIGSIIVHTDISPLKITQENLKKGKKGIGHSSIKVHLVSGGRNILNPYQSFFPLKNKSICCLKQESF